MAATVPFKRIKLTADDVPGAHLPNPVVSVNSVASLRRFLQVRGVKVAKDHQKKKDLIELVNHWLDRPRDIDPTIDRGKWLEKKVLQERKKELNEASITIQVFPVTCWKRFPSVKIPICFSYGVIYKHLIETAVVGMHSTRHESGDDSFDEANENNPQSFATTKPLRRGRNYFSSGHIQKIQDQITSDGTYNLKATVWGSMKQNSYTVMVKLDGESAEVVDASCECRAQQLLRCSHVGSLLFALEDYTINFGYDPLPCTSQLCSWNQGRQLKSSAPVFSRQYQNKRDPARVKNFLAIPEPNPSEVKDLLKYLSQTTHQSTMFDMLLKFDYADYIVSLERTEVLTILREQMQGALTFGLDSPACVPGTENQVDSDLWIHARSYMITASVCHKFLTRDHKDLGKKIHSSLWVPQPKLKSAAVEYGRRNEGNARQAYTAKTGNLVEQTGMWVNPQYPGLGASPDGIVTCMETGQRGLLEIKCSYLLKNHKPADLHLLKESQRKRFYLTENEGVIVFNKKHQYYQQIQMQLGITDSLWCDFVSWTPKDIFILRMYRSDAWWKDASKTLLTIHAEYIIPDYFEMRTPRKLPPFQLQQYFQPNW